MTDLPTLADRVAQAEGAERALDARICEAAGYEVRYDRKHNDPTPYYEPVKDYSWQPVPAYTRSLDAAMTLVPEGWFLTLDRYLISDEPGVRGCWRVWLKFIRPTDQIEKVFARADTPALALCAAALRSLHASGAGEG